MRRQLLLVLFVVPALSFSAPWSHIELGGGNYGADGHTRKSQLMTVGAQLRVTNQSNYIDDLPQEDPFCYVPGNQYRVLFDTLDELVKQHGSDDGVFHVNDLFAEYADYAVEKLKRYAVEKGYNRLVIESIHGDYTRIDPKETLKAYHLQRYDTAHLKNFEVSFFMAVMDGEQFISTPESRSNGRKGLQRLANLAVHGLELIVVYHPNFIPLEEKQLMEGHIFYQPTNATLMPYFFPEGVKFPAIFTRAFHIQSLR
jgi:hypothetical protein